ncbi:protein associated with UVRAG as autophagy enhancer isoform X2 [Neoarius graeffei]|uniref:protein associated with UVRAG as autophagy enhancer isoform X2 n=1 Tax=Neoarius graeffei TaxID=443677 RepID=UPI00298C8536|nr:protein associated with UVRAG as autophagy enhancer isoform X2 [Neoarius graeffei]
MSLSDSFPQFNGCGSANLMMRVENQIVEGDQGKPVFGNIPDGQGSISGESDDEEWYHLPRSSPVISRRQKKKMTKLPSSNNSFFHEQSNENVQKEVGPPSVSKPLQNILPEEQTSSARKIFQVLLSDTHCVPAAIKDGKCFDKQRNVSRGASESQSSSCEESDLRNTAGESQLERRTVTWLNKSLISGAEHEEQICEAFYRNSVDLDQENAHFVVVDMVLEVLEAAKWAMSQKHSDSFSSTDSGYEELCDHRFSSNRISQTLTRRCSAESLAQTLLQELERCWISSEELRGEFPLATVSMASGGGASLSNEIRQKSRMRGTLMWTPPQFQIITSVNPTQRRSDVVASQHFLCAGCGTEIEPRYMKRLRYCDYLGKYFCDGCHGGGEAIIPARVLSRWDFGRYPVCQFSKQLLESIWEKPCFNIISVAKTLYSQAKELQKFKEIQEQLISIKKLLRTCRLSEGLWRQWQGKTPSDNIRKKPQEEPDSKGNASSSRVLTEFQQLPSHLSEELHLFAMDDLVKIKRGQLLTTTKAVMQSATHHVKTCELCQAKGFVCEFCRGKDILFPFQTDICTRCQECRACFHSSCFRDKVCPKCIRLQTRRASMR